MNTTTSGGEQGRKPYSAKAQLKAHSGTRCSFCWFVMTTYPTLKGMNERDDGTFKSVHNQGTPTSRRHRARTCCSDLPAGEALLCVEESSRSRRGIVRAPGL